MTLCTIFAGNHRVLKRDPPLTPPPLPPRQVAVDCTGALPKCHGMASMLSLRQMPYVSAFVAAPSGNPYTGKASRAPSAYEGTGTARSLQKHVLAELPSVLLPRVTGAAWPPSAEARTNDHGRLQPVVLLFTDRDTPSPLYKALALHFSGRLAFAEVHSSQTELKAKYDISTFPTLLTTFTSKGGGENDDATAVREQARSHAMDACSTRAPPLRSISLVSLLSPRVDTPRVSSPARAIVSSWGYPWSQVVYKGDLKSWGEVTAFLGELALGEDNAPTLKNKGKAEGKKAKGKAEGPLVAGAGAVELTSAAELQANVMSSDDAWVVLYHTYDHSSAGERLGFMRGAEGHGPVLATVGANRSGPFLDLKVDCCPPGVCKARAAQAPAHGLRRRSSATRRRGQSTQPRSTALRRRPSAMACSRAPRRSQPTPTPRSRCSPSAAARRRRRT